ncbi:hypothetical protein ASPSYDRAFT_42220 [Aspergillus sydowii CBS 593.65]|uniref:Zn(2)-C6 fungal-type domain-containing protein n=1 Tax=Aspergillus sydowii CBS 593.65 TaxID=1036612 RepID=A0A1L9TM22_9EURO|nr:uncharacterized protein ASPSYDRAFT_42220 [Aspergillus sydowii CBS 593.65]OJJ60477.1 hypothetical protein ASPSYDRAFT_42220 [Aspergillus sydowii CBS 593.65]
MSQRANTRSRAGCLTCRQRHVRCDEQRPSCQACLAGNRSCNYAAPVIPLRDRRMLQKNALPPGQQAPWALAKADGMTGRKRAPGSAMDPFDILPIKMPFKSQELYHYFYHTGAAFAVAPADPKDDCIALATHDEHALRSTLLLAGIHYCWNTGNLQDYESAFLFHKVESIRIVNSWLGAAGSKTFLACVRQILTISLSEACLGNLAAAETHLNGVMALFDSHGQAAGACDKVDDIDSELASRYLLLTSCFVLALKSRLEDFTLFRAAQGIDPNDDGSSSEALHLMKMWHKIEYRGLETRLKAIRLFPYFFSPPPIHGKRPKSVDAMPIIDCLKKMTEAADLVCTNPTPQNINRVWNDGGPTKLLLILVTSHISSFSNDDKDQVSATGGKPSQPLLQSSWSGISAAVELYMHSVLNIVNAGEPLESRLLYRILLILKRDIEQTRADLGGTHGSLRQSLWFWKAFLGALALSNHMAIDTRASTPDKWSCEADLDDLYEWFRDCVRAWSAVTGTTDWSVVRSRLAMFAWPAALSCDGKGFGEDIWAQMKKTYG